MIDDWKDNAEYKTDVTVEYGFIVQEDFYFGPENNFTEKQYEEMRSPLYLPDIKISGNFVLVSDIEGKEEDLIRHYKDVVEKHKEYKQNLTNSTYFWNRPVIYNDDFVISFPWYDRFRESKAFLKKFTTNEDGEIYWDADQCWEIEIYRDGGLFYAKEWDPDYQEVHCEVKFDVQPVYEQTEKLITSVQNLIETMTKATRKDYWT